MRSRKVFRALFDILGLFVSGGKSWLCLKHRTAIARSSWSVAAAVVIQSCLQFLCGDCPPLYAMRRWCCLCAPCRMAFMG